MNEVECFDEVSMDDSPTGRLVTKQQAHDERLLHRCAAVFVFNDRGDLYMQPHKKANGRYDHTVGGHVSSGEDYKTAAAREMQEEVGIEGVELEEIATSYYSDEGAYVHMFGIYQCVAPKDWTFIQTEEVDELILMSVKDIVDDMNQYGQEKYVTGFIKTMQKYLETVESDMEVSMNIKDTTQFDIAVRKKS